MKKVYFVDMTSAYVDRGDMSIEHVAVFRFCRHDPGDVIAAATRAPRSRRRPRYARTRVGARITRSARSGHGCAGFPNQISMLPGLTL